MAHAFLHKDAREARLCAFSHPAARPPLHAWLAHGGRRFHLQAKMRVKFAFELLYACLCFIFYI
jgi:molybdopterin-guanine dinucleotide biosynthesis protein A